MGDKKQNFLLLAYQQGQEKVMKILFCTDGSETSLYAIEKALTLLKKDFEIDILTVIETGFFKYIYNFSLRN